MAQTSPVQPGRREFCASPRGVVDEALVEGDWCPGTPARMLKSVQEAAMKLYSYVVEHDAGYAPNPYFGFCTLCRCKFQKPGVGRKNIVELAEEGDWVIGTGGASKRSAGHGKLIYAMLVTEKLTREEYFSDSRFLQKKPMKTNASTYEQKRGDNVRPRFVLRSASNLFSCHDTSSTLETTPLTFRQNSVGAVSKRRALGSGALPIQRMSAGLSTGWKRNGNPGNTGNRARG